MPDAAALFDAATIVADTFVRHVELHDALPSTNDRALELAGAPSLELPALVVARRQTAGRGRGANRWWSAEGALTFSLILDTSRWCIAQREWPQLSLATAEAVRDALQTELTSPAQRAGASAPPAEIADGPARPNPHSKNQNPPSRVAVKPPNDVLLDGRKVAGILIESPGGAAPAKDRLIIGIGINVNNSWRNAPPNTGHGIALCDASGRTHELLAVLVSLLNALDSVLRQLGSNRDRK